jgi:hypothetical protein
VIDQELNGFEGSLSPKNCQPLQLHGAAYPSPPPSSRAFRVELLRFARNDKSGAKKRKEKESKSKDVRAGGEGKGLWMVLMMVRKQEDLLTLASRRS